MVKPMPPHDKKKHHHAHAADTNKARSAWYFTRSTFPLRDAPPTELELAWERLAEVRKPEHSWETVGPRNIAGRVTCLVAHPKEPKTLHAGTAGGGVWRSVDGGETWEIKWNLNFSHNIGAMAVFPGASATLIVATGEANLSADCYPGSGFYMSLDGGDRWS